MTSRPVGREARGSTQHHRTPAIHNEVKGITMHKRLRRGLAAVAIGVSAAVALVGCASGSSSASGGSASDVSAALKKGGTITYWSWTPSAKAQVAAFEKAYPKVHVKLVNAGTGTDEYTKLQNTIKAGSGAPDVAQVEYFAVPQFALSNSWPTSPRTGSARSRASTPRARGTRSP